MSDEAKFWTQQFTFLSIGSRVGRVATFSKKSCYLLLASLKFVTFVRRYQKLLLVHLSLVQCLLTNILGPIN